MIRRYALGMTVAWAMLIAPAIRAQDAKKEDFPTPQPQYEKLLTVPPADEKKVKKNGSRKEEKRVYELINKANELPSDSAARAFDYIEEALALSLQYADKRGEAYAYITLGAVHYSLKRYLSSLNYYNKALNIFGETKEEAGLYHVLGHVGSVYDALEQYDDALKHYNEFLVLARDREDWPDILVTQSALARVYYAMGNYDQAVIEYEALVEQEGNHGTPNGVSDALNGLGMAYKAQGDLKNAGDNLTAAYELADSIGDFSRAERFYDGANDVNQSADNTSGRISLQSRRVELNSYYSNTSEVMKGNQAIGKIYLEEDRVGEALPYLNRTIDLAEELGELEAQQEAYSALSEAYEKEGDYKLALENFKKSIEVNASIQEEQQEKLLAELKLNNQVSLREARIDNLEDQMALDRQRIDLLERERSVQNLVSKRQLWIIYGLVGGLLAVLAASFLFYRSSQQKRKANQLLALRSLRSQMNPHFIFNSLNSVNSFISRNDERSANKYLSDFSRLMRAVMENSNYDFVPLDSEVSILKLYLGLEHFRFSNKFEYTFEVDEELDQEQVQIPPMLIQPYIENAIWHGLRYKEEKGLLAVQLRKEDKKLVVTVEDNGIGRKRSMELKTKNQRDKKSTGLRNTEERLNLINRLNQMAYQVRIIDLEENGEPTGTKVVLELPLTTDKIKEL